MGKLNVSSITGQVAAHLREELVSGRWKKTMPGRNLLAEQLGVSRKTVQGALDQLEDEGVLEGQGSGRPRRIALEAGGAPSRLRIVFLDYEPQEKGSALNVDLMHALEEAGHAVSHASKSLVQLGMDVKRIARMVQGTEASAWVVGGASQEVLKWFAAQETPVIALFGRRRQLEIAGVGPSKVSAYARVAREFHQLGHRRIVLLCREMRRLPEPGAPERAFLEELKAHGQTIGPYNLPDWEDNMNGFQKLLKALFRTTPPTALMVDEAYLLSAVQQFFNTRGIRTPDDISLVCSDADPTFAWCQPSVAHIHWDHRPVVHRIVRWAANVSRGKQDLRQTITKAELIMGGTIGPVKK